MNIEHIIINVLRIFGSWLFVYVVYFLARVNTKQSKNLSRGEVALVYVRQLGLVIAVVGFVGGAGLLASNLNNWDFFIEMVIVTITPALFGIHNGLVGPDMPNKS